MITFKEQTKVSWNEGKYKKSLSDEELKIYKSLTRNEKDHLVLFYLNNTPISLSDRNWFSELSNRISEREKEQSKEIVEKNKQSRYDHEKNENKSVSTTNNINKDISKLGITEPSNELKTSFENLKLTSKLGGVFAGLAGASMSLKEQEFMKEHVSHTKQNFAIMSQNEKLIKQNDEIIELLKIIANK